LRSSRRTNLVVVRQETRKRHRFAGQQRMAGCRISASQVKCAALEMAVVEKVVSSRGIDEALDPRLARSVDRHAAV